jgi:hypothetical protein
MNWNTVYIKGKTDFWEDVKGRIEKSALNCMIGNFEQLADGTYQGLYWLDGQVDIQELKEAIGAKLIWDNRLRFYTEDELNQPEEVQKKTRFNERERSLIQKMRSKFKKRAAA